MTTVEDPDPEDWQKKAAFCADSIVDVTPFAEVLHAIEMECRTRAGLFDDQKYFFQSVDLVCEQQAPGECPDWSPADNISLDGTTRVIALDLIDSLLADPSPLVVCDGTRFTRDSEDLGFEVINVMKTDLAHALGLRQGDLIVSFDQQPLEDMARVYGAIIAFRDAGESNHELVVSRRGVLVDLQYEVVP